MFMIDRSIDCVKRIGW